MLARQGQPVFPNGGSFQNGIVNAPTQGAEFFDWKGNTTGYEGHLVYSWFFLQATLTQHPEHLQRILRPVLQTGIHGAVDSAVPEGKVRSDSRDGDVHQGEPL